MEWTRLKNYFMQEMKAELAEDPEGLSIYSGMALGVDTVFFLAGKELKDAGYPVTLHAVIPFRGQDSQWPPESRKLYREMLCAADSVTEVSAPGYAPWKMSARNRALVDLVAGPGGRMEAVVHAGAAGKGGSADCAAYAREKNVPVHVIRPEMITDRKKYLELMEDTGSTDRQEDLEHET
jgi:predicted Rossmann fold nucleotide-binding protein DprA/Smf involved in DNA uptake